MAIITLDHPIQLPVGELAKRLKEALPRIRWTIGDGEQHGLISLDRPTSIIGRPGDGDLILLGIEQLITPLPLDSGAAPHHCHILLRGPSFEEEDFASRMLLIVAGTLLWSAGRGQFQRQPGGAWISGRDMTEGMERCVADVGKGQFNALTFLNSVSGGSGPPRTRAEELLRESDMEHSFAAAVASVMGKDVAAQMGFAAPPSYAEEEPRANRLPTFVIAIERPLDFDWAPYLDIGQFDPDGNWHIEPGPNGTGTVRGRGTVVTISADPQPIPGYMLKNALARSFWFKDAASLERRIASLVITCDIDTRAAPFEDVRETAKFMTLVLGLLTRAPAAVALLNNGVHTLLSPEMVQSQVGHLHKNQIPVMLWTWTAPNSMERDNVSLTSGGLLPFLGYEIEVWNAPGKPDWVGDKMSEVINYLLHVGPIVNAGETFGEVPGDRSIRAFFGTTRAERWDKDVPVMFLEFDNPSGIERPKPDPLPQRSFEPSPQAPVEPSRPGLFGRRLFGRKTS